jgi:hypothetical protein
VISAFTMPAFSAGATWVIGKVFMQHFASGGTLLDLTARLSRVHQGSKEKWAPDLQRHLHRPSASAAQNGSSKARRPRDQHRTWPCRGCWRRRSSPSGTGEETWRNGDRRRIYVVFCLLAGSQAATAGWASSAHFCCLVFTPC